jgi:hypothetical protein
MSKLLGNREPKEAANCDFAQATHLETLFLLEIYELAISEENA